MSWHDLALALIHVEDMVPVIPLTSNVCITRHKAFSFM